MASNIEYPAQKLFVARITAVGSAVGADAAGTGYIPHAWQEVRLSGSGRAYVDDELGLVGTTTVCPAYTLNGETLAVDDIVYLRMRGWSDADSGIIFDVVSKITSAAAAGAFSGARYNTVSGLSFDTDGYFNIATPTVFTAALPGYYSVGIQHSFSGSSLGNTMVTASVASFFGEGCTVSEWLYASPTPEIVTLSCSTLILLDIGPYKVFYGGNHYAAGSSPGTLGSRIQWIKYEGPL